MGVEGHPVLVKIVFVNTITHVDLHLLDTITSANRLGEPAWPFREKQDRDERTSGLLNICTFINEALYIKVEGRLATNFDLNWDFTTLCVNGNLIFEFCEK